MFKTGLRPCQTVTPVSLFLQLKRSDDKTVKGRVGKIKNILTSTEV